VFSSIKLVLLQTFRQKAGQAVENQEYQKLKS